MISHRSQAMIIKLYESVLQEFLNTISRTIALCNKSNTLQSTKINKKLWIPHHGASLKSLSLLVLCFQFEAFSNWTRFVVDPNEVDWPKAKSVSVIIIWSHHMKWILSNPVTSPTDVVIMMSCQIFENSHLTCHRWMVFPVTSSNL